MKSLVIYILQMIACSGILYGYYHLFLRNNRFHQYNRFYLLVIIVASAVLPLVKIPVTVQQIDNIVYQSIEAVQSSVAVVASGFHESKNSISLSTILYVLYLVLAIVFITRIVLSVRSIYRLKKQSTSIQVEDIVFIQTTHPDAPFSFFRWLFWHHKIRIHSESGQQVLRHEMYHINKKHTWDLLFIEVATAVFWFNPVFYMIRRELKTIHEFLADDYATSGRDTKQYAGLLLTRAFDTNNLQLVNPFFHNQLKRRIAMLTKSKKPAYQYLRKLMVLPLTAVAVLLFAFTYNKEIKEVKKSVEEKIAAIEDVKIPIDFSESDKAFMIKDTIPVFKNGFRIPLGDTLVIINGKEFMTDRRTRMKNIELKNIESISVLKPNEAVRRYGEKGKNGAIIISTDKNVILKIEQGNNVRTSKMQLDEVVVVGYGKDVDKNTGEVKNVTVSPLSFDKGEGVFTEAEVPAQYPTGDRAWKNLLERNLRGDVPIEKGLKPGNYTTQTQFVVEKNGTISNIKSLTHLGFGMEEEAVRVIKKSGIWKPAMQNGHIVRSIYSQPITFQILENDKMASVKNVPEPEIFTKVERDAYFPGPAGAWKSFLEKNMNAQIPADKGIAPGNYTAIVQFIVDRLGNVSDIKPLTKLGYGIEDEAVRLIKLSGNWKPAVQNGREVKAYRKQSITFQIPEKKVNS